MQGPDLHDLAAGSQCEGTKQNVGLEWLTLPTRGVQSLFFRERLCPCEGFVKAL